MTETLITITLDAADPGELPLPTAAVRWHITEDNGFYPVVEITGTQEAVDAFVADNWGMTLAEMEA